MTVAALSTPRKTTLAWRLVDADAAGRSGPVVSVQADVDGQPGQHRRMARQRLQQDRRVRAQPAGRAARLPVALDRGDEANMPATALAHVPADLRARPVFNEYGFGGYLIFKGVRPFIDGRTDMYGDAFMARYGKIVSPDPAALDAAIRQYQIAWTILPPDSPVVAELNHKAGWRRLYADKYAVVQVRQADPGEPAQTRAQ